MVYRQRKKLRVIPEPKEGTRAVLKKDPQTGSVIFEGSGILDLQCGSCEAILAKGVTEGQLRNLVLHCNQCDSYNEIL